MREALESVRGARYRTPASLPRERKAESSPLRSRRRRRAESDNPIYRRTFVGREPELRQLQAAFDAALSGQGALAMVVGEPGIGKTALCEQLATYAALRGGRTLVGHCYEEGSLSLPYLPFVEAMRSYVLAREPEALRAGARLRRRRRRPHRLARCASAFSVEPRAGRRPRGGPLAPAAGGQRLPAQRQRRPAAAASCSKTCTTPTAARSICCSTWPATSHGARLLIVGTYRDVEVDRAHPLSARWPSCAAARASVARACCAA